jgi:nucleoside-diphosphate-sugar epimerase
MATYLVTGAAGFIASKVCEQLHVAGHTVIAIDNLNDYYDVRLKDYRISALLGANALPVGSSKTASVYASRVEGVTSSSGRLTFLPIDIEHLRDLESLFTRFKFDAVFNLAARAGVRASMANPYVFLSTNTEGTLNILECQRRFGVKKQILASTSSLYAGCPMPFVEDQPVNTPLSPYAAAKKAAELMAYTYYKLYGLDISIVRYFTVYGPAGRPDMAPFRFIKWISEGCSATDRKRAISRMSTTSPAVRCSPRSWWATRSSILAAAIIRSDSRRFSRWWKRRWGAKRSSTVSRFISPTCVRPGQTFRRQNGCSAGNRKCRSKTVSRGRSPGTTRTQTLCEESPFDGPRCWCDLSNG